MGTGSCAAPAGLGVPREWGPTAPAVGYDVSSLTGLEHGAARYRLAELAALALKSAVWETMITQCPLRLAIR
jgi:hypothetical protein